MMLSCPRYMALVALMALLAADPTNAFWNTKKKEPEVKKEEPPAVAEAAVVTEPVVEEEKRTLEADVPVEYGVDISYPMHKATVSTNYPWLPHNVDPTIPVPPEYEGMPIQPLGDRQGFFDKYMAGCVESYGESCYRNERDRIEMNVRQIQSMINYTETGFLKIKAPERVFKLLRDFWEANKDKAKNEDWPAGNIYTNHWESPTKILSVEDASLVGGGYVLKQNIWNSARDSISEWTGQQLAECSLYGIRIYEAGAVLAPHVDRLPLVSSAIINVDQDVDEPWPLEVIGHDGKAHNVTMEPGDLVLYESHSILHGRQFPLKGRFMANVFIHFEPVGPLGANNNVDRDLPLYVIPGSPEESNWRMHNPDGWKLLITNNFATGSTEAHHAAASGDIQRLETVLSTHAEAVNQQDGNGWAPIHEAARGGFTEVAKYLIERGADVNAMVKGGGTALYLAREHLGAEHPVVKFLQSVGAHDFGPEL